MNMTAIAATTTTTSTTSPSKIVEPASVPAASTTNSSTMSAVASTTHSPSKDDSVTDVDKQSNNVDANPRLFLIPGGLSFDGALQGNMSSSRAPQWTFANEGWKNSRKICAATRPEDIYVFFLKESGAIYKVGKVLQVESSDMVKDQLVTFSRVVPVIGCEFEEIASLGALQGGESRLERSCARQVKGYAASDLALAISKALEAVGGRKQMRLGRAVNMVLTDTVRRLEKEKEKLVIASRSNLGIEESLRSENEALKLRLKEAEAKLRELEKDRRRSLTILDLKTKELSFAKKSLTDVISAAGGIMDTTRESLG